MKVEADQSHTTTSQRTSAGRALDRSPQSQKESACQHPQEPPDRTLKADCSIWLYFLIQLHPTTSLSSAVLMSHSGEEGH